jgi:hypothetical protein
MEELDFKYYVVAKFASARCNRDYASINKVKIHFHYEGLSLLLLLRFGKGTTKTDEHITVIFKEAARCNKSLENVIVSTVDKFQGQESNIVVLDLVIRSSQHATYGFMSDRHRLNVAISRARDVLIVIGDANKYNLRYAKAKIPTQYQKFFYQAGAPVGPPSNQMCVNEQPFYGQWPVGSVPNPFPCQVCINGPPFYGQWPVGSVPNPFPCQLCVNRPSFYGQWPVGSIPNPLSGYTPESLQRHSQQDGDLLTQEQSGSYGEKPSDWDSLINYPLSDACSNVSAYQNPFPDQDFSAHPVDVTQASTLLQPSNTATHFPAPATNIGSQSLGNIRQDGCMSDFRETGTAYNQVTWTVNPKDLLRTPVADDCAQQFQSDRKVCFSLLYVSLV